MSKVKIVHNDDDTVTVPKVYYDMLVEDSNWLECLASAGVDNWNGYEYAQEIYHEQYGDEE